MALTLQQFLEAVTPDSGKKIVAHMKDGQSGGRSFKYFVHRVCEDHSQMRTAVGELLKTKTDVYYALASFQQGFHPKPSDPSKQQVRVRTNVHQLKAVWFDIDFKDGLSDPAQVVAALREFSKGTGMPPPSILVHSGNGVHVYWPFTKAIGVEDWLRLANALKHAAQVQELRADLACTADPCRVLRPVKTVNWKDPNNPKVVRGSFTGKLHDPDQLYATLQRSSASSDGELSTVPAYLSGVVEQGDYKEIQGGVSGRSSVEYYFSNITPKCAVLGHVLASGGRDQSEPEWKDTLQLLSHCKDGEMFIHEVSKGHIDYDPEATREKYIQRIEGGAGPTLCDTFAAYHPDACKSCPMRGKIKTPLVLGEEAKAATPTGKTFPLTSWRPMAGNAGMERKMFDAAANQYYWEKVLNRSWELKATARGLTDGTYSHTFLTRLGSSNPIEIDIPGFMMGSLPDLKKTLAEAGANLRQSEIKHWQDLMNTWIEKLQAEKKEGECVDRMGWIRNPDPDNPADIGFTAGTTSFYKSGNHKTGLRVTAEYKEIAKHYEPKGKLAPWKKAADFIAAQDNPSFTAILASAFAAPIFRSTGMPGAMLTLVSTESGVGKTSVMKTAQAVWGNPTNGMNSTSDTYLSVIRKVGFLQNLPLYWDEIRGMKALENFYSTAFDVAQGKERTRLNSGAQMRTINTWQTMVIGASNESLFDFMAHQGGASDAATARTFEITIEPFDDPARAAHNAMFGMLDSNFGRAGQVYAEFLAEHPTEVKRITGALYEKLYMEWGLVEGERFWAAICASLLVGAKLAQKCGLVDINVNTLRSFLHDNITKLRIRTKSSMLGSTPRELVIGYMQAHQDGQLTIDEFPKRGSRKEPVVKRPPKSRLMVVKAGDVIRIRKQDFTDWLLKSKNMNWSSVAKHMKSQLGAKEITTTLASGTEWELPRTRCLELEFKDGTEQTGQSN